MPVDIAPSTLRQSPSDALALSQHAAHGIEKKSLFGALFAIPFISSPESADSWATCEIEMYSCLRTGDDKAAHICLEKLVERFGADNERVMGLRGLYQEAMAGNNAALEDVLLEYEQVLAVDPINTVQLSYAASGLLSGADAERI